MTRSERRLMILLRAVGAVTALAIVAVFMPRAWMAWCHEMLGLGTLPEGPVIEYLARCTSLFYTLLGGVLLWLSRDVRRHAKGITVVGVLTVACGVVVLSIDMRSGLPWWWTVSDGPFGVVFGVALLLLRMRARGEVKAAEATAPADEGEEPVGGADASDAGAPAGA